MVVTVITVNRNNSVGLKKTIESVLSQSFAEYEYIIIDGASTDNSVEVIKSYGDRISLWKSEPDKGVYDAMNKGLGMASGEWICFMNSGDCFDNDKVLENVFSVNRIGAEAADVVYGDTMYEFSWGHIFGKPYKLSALKRRMAFCHQSSFVRTEEAKKIGFDVSFRIAADYNMFYHLYIQGGRFLYLPSVIADYEAENGMSSVNIGRREVEYAKIAGRYGTFSWKTEFIWRMTVEKFKRLLKSIVPSSLLARYRKNKACC